nr:hypothetical protein [Paracoccus sp. PAMC 22219]
MLPRNPFKIIGGGGTFCDFCSLLDLGINEARRWYRDNGRRRRHLGHVCDCHWLVNARGISARECLHYGRHGLMRQVFHRSGAGELNRIAQADIVLGRLQEGLGRDTVIGKSRFLRKLQIALDELLCRASDLASGTRALKDAVSRTTLLL